MSVRKKQPSKLEQAEILSKVKNLVCGVTPAVLEKEPVKEYYEKKASQIQNIQRKERCNEIVVSKQVSPVASLDTLCSVMLKQGCYKHRKLSGIHN